MPRSSISVWIVEDSDEQRNNLIALLEEVNDMHCGGAYATCEALLEALIESPLVEEPDVFVLDVEILSGRKPMMSGIEGARVLRQMQPESAIIMLTVRDEAEVIYAALGAGACGYLVKPLVTDEVVNGIREAHRGGMCMSPPVARKVGLFFQRQKQQAEEYELSEREREILRLMERGFRQLEMAAELHLSRHTVDSHLRNIYQKLHVNSAAEAVGKAIRKGEI
ncbi:MAG: response regulator transcription factor [Rhodothermales bacterium]